MGRVAPELEWGDLKLLHSAASSKEIMEYLGLLWWQGEGRGERKGGGKREGRDLFYLTGLGPPALG